MARMNDCCVHSTLYKGARVGSDVGKSNMFVTVRRALVALAAHTSKWLAPPQSMVPVKLGSIRPSSGTGSSSASSLFSLVFMLISNSAY